jgi:hypothetical protein
MGAANGSFDCNTGRAISQNQYNNLPPNMPLSQSIFYIARNIVGFLKHFQSFKHTTFKYTYEI